MPTSIPNPRSILPTTPVTKCTTDVNKTVPSVSVAKDPEYYSDDESIVPKTTNTSTENKKL